jgi:competence protein ComGC
MDRILKLKSKKGFGTIEVVLIIAVLISIALIFRTAIMSYATAIITAAFGDQSILSEFS